MGFNDSDWYNREFGMKNNPQKDHLEIYHTYVQLSNINGLPLVITIGRQKMSYGDNRVFGPVNGEMLVNGYGMRQSFLFRKATILWISFTVALCFMIRMNSPYPIDGVMKALAYMATMHGLKAE